MLHYAICHTRVIATGKEGDATGEFDGPAGVAIHEETHQIFVANYLNGRVEIFSETGEFFHQLGIGELSRPWGIAIHLYARPRYIPCLRVENVWNECFGNSVQKG